MFNNWSYDEYLKCCATSELINKINQGKPSEIIANFDNDETQHLEAVT